MRLTFSETSSNTKMPNIFLQCALCHVFTFIQAQIIQCTQLHYLVWGIFPKPAGQFPFQHVLPYRVKYRSNFCTAHCSSCFFHNSSLQNFVPGKLKMCRNRSPEKWLAHDYRCITRLLWWVPGQQSNYHTQSFPVMVQRITVRHMVGKSKIVATGTTGKGFFFHNQKYHLTQYCLNRIFKENSAIAPLMHLLFQTPNKQEQ